MAATVVMFGRVRSRQNKSGEYSTCHFPYSTCPSHDDVPYDVECGVVDGGDGRSKYRLHSIVHRKSRRDDMIQRMICVYYLFSL